MHNMHPIGIRGVLSFSGRVSSYCSSRGSCRVTLIVKSQAIVMKRAKRTELLQRQTEFVSVATIILEHLTKSWWRQQIFCIDDFNLTTRDHWFRSTHVSNNLTLTTSSEILHRLRNINYISRCCWNVFVFTYKWKVNNGKIKIISLVLAFRS